MCLQNSSVRCWIDHILGSKTNLSNFKKIEIMMTLFSDHNSMNWINNKRCIVCGNEVMYSRTTIKNEDIEGKEKLNFVQMKMEIKITKLARYSKCQSKQEVPTLGRKDLKSTTYLHIARVHEIKEMKQKISRSKEMNHRINKFD